MKVFVTLFLITLRFGLFAGDTPLDKAKVDFKKVNVLYTATPVYSLDVQYAVFDNHTGGNLVEQKFGQYVKNRLLSYTKILGIETIVNEKKTIIVNNEDHALIITDTRKIELSPIQTNIDTLLKLCKDIKMKNLGVSERYYSLIFDDAEANEFSKIDIYINLSNYSIKKMVMFYNEAMPLTQNDFYAKEKKPRLEITYKPFVKMTSASEELFAESSYVTMTDNTYRGKGKYSNYKIINQLQSARFKKK